MPKTKALPVAPVQQKPKFSLKKLFPFQKEKIVKKKEDSPRSRLGAAGAFVLWFDEVDKNSIALVGGKNANLGEMWQNLTKLKTEENLMTIENMLCEIESLEIIAEIHKH